MVISSENQVYAFLENVRIFAPKKFRNLKGLGL